MPGQAGERGAGRLREIAEFGDNPGNLRLFAIVPETLKPGPALVVILHGCKQTAAGYDLGTGWSELAEREGFILCAPEQKRENNPNNCFSWFQAPDIARDRGEAASIRAMVEHLAAQHGVDRSRIFVTGLSAGGAMTSVMLSTYPEVFAAGAVIAGLPYGVATSVHAAFESMARGDSRTPQEAAEAVRAASGHAGPWPRLSVWHGTGDHTVTHDNSGAVVAQWAHLMGLHASPLRQETVDGQLRRVWAGLDGSEVIEEYVVEGLGHGTPLSAGPGDTQFGEPGPYLLEAGISSTWRIAQFWGLVASERHEAAATPVRAEAADGASTEQASPGESAHAGMARGLMDSLKPMLSTDVQETIRKSLHKAGLL
jgi:feruloyl esterase